MEQTNANEFEDYIDMDEFELEEPLEEIKEETQKKVAPHSIRSYVDPNKVGTTEEDIPDLLYLINANVEHLTPEQMRLEEENGYDYIDIDATEQEEPQEEVKEEPNKKTTPRVIRSYVDPNLVGTKKEDIPDLLWLINAEVEHLTPE